MKAFFAAFATFFANANRSWLSQVLLGAGIGLATMTALTVFADYYKDQFLINLGALGTVAGILGLAGLDKALSVIIGAYLASMYIKTFAASVRIVKK